jgi:asparagine N-glycosylation enzyme membrane subunit Stt3
MLPIAEFYATAGLLALPWAVVGLLAFWVWRRSRSGGHLVVCVGSGWLVLDAIFRMIDVRMLGADSGYWGTFIGAALIAGGFWVTVAPLVAADVAKLLGRPTATTPAPPLSPPPPHGAARA